MDNTGNPKDFIKERFKELPPELQKAVSATDWTAKVKIVADKNGLMLDQMGTLQYEVLFVMLGIEPASDFVGNMVSRLNIKRDKAEAIAKNINEVVFGPIRSYLQKWEEEEKQSKEIDHGAGEETVSDSSVSSIERAGSFEIEKGAPGAEGGAAEGDGGAAVMTETDKINMLSDIEEPKPAPKANRIIPDMDEVKIEPMIDQLLGGPASRPQEKVEKKPEPPAPANLPTGTEALTAAPQAPKAPPKSDPYREPIK